MDFVGYDLRAGDSLAVHNDLEPPPAGGREPADDARCGSPARERTPSLALGLQRHEAALKRLDPRLRIGLWA